MNKQLTTDGVTGEIGLIIWLSTKDDAEAAKKCSALFDSLTTNNRLYTESNHLRDRVEYYKEELERLKKRKRKKVRRK